MPYVNYKDPGPETKQEYELIPEGTYLVNVEEVYDDKKTRKGDEMFRLRLKIVEGEYEGKSLFDTIVFSDKAFKRQRLVTTRLGIDKEYVGNITPSMLVDKKARVTTVHETYDGVTRNKITFDGYEPVNGEPVNAKPKSDEDDNLPF